MRVMVMVRATRNSEAGVMPDEKLLANMGRFNEELVKAGESLAGEGLHPSYAARTLRAGWQQVGSPQPVERGAFAFLRESAATHIPRPGRRLLIDTGKALLRSAQYSRSGPVKSPHRGHW
jgi:hypothetical protein